MADPGPNKPGVVAGLKAGFFEEIGTRPSLEDRICAQQLKALDCNRACFFGVFDGHGGETASTFIEHKLHAQVEKTLGPVVKRGVPLNDGAVLSSLTSAFAEVDAQLCATDEGGPGTTASTLLLLDDKCYAANVGDSRVILCRGGQAVTLTKDQKPSDPDEEQRIKDAGGFVINGRVMGQLAVSRAFGDREFKGDGKTGFDDDEDVPGWTAPLVIATPVIQTAVLDGSEDFLLLACDGLFDVMSNREACSFVVEQLVKTSNDPAAVAHALARHAVFELGSTDNVSVLIVALRELGHADTERGKAEASAAFLAENGMLPEELEKVKAMFQAKAAEGGGSDLSKAAFTALVKECLKASGEKDAPTDADLAVAFTIADEDKGGTVDMREFTKLYKLVRKGQVTGLGKKSIFGGSKKAAAFGNSLKKTNAPVPAPRPAPEPDEPEPEPGLEPKAEPESEPESEPELAAVPAPEPTASLEAFVPSETGGLLDAARCLSRIDVAVARHRAGWAAEAAHLVASAAEAEAHAVAVAAREARRRKEGGTGVSTGPAGDEQVGEGVAAADEAVLPRVAMGAPSEAVVALGTCSQRLADCEAALDAAQREAAGNVNRHGASLRTLEDLCAASPGLSALEERRRKAAAARDGAARAGAAAVEAAKAKLTTARADHAAAVAALQEAQRDVASASPGAAKGASSGSALVAAADLAALVRGVRDASAEIEAHRAAIAAASAAARAATGANARADAGGDEDVDAELARDKDAAAAAAADLEANLSSLEASAAAPRGSSKAVVASTAATSTAVTAAAVAAEARLRSFLAEMGRAGRCGNAARLASARLLAACGSHALACSAALDASLDATSAFARACTEEHLFLSMDAVAFQR